LEQPAPLFFAAVGFPKVIFEGDFKMELVQQVRHGIAKTEARSYELTIIFGYSLIATLLLMVMVVAFGGPGVSPEDLASMTQFP
jgi:hypothetical protein